MFKDAGLVRPDRFAQGVADGSFEAGVVLYGNQVRMIPPEARQHARVYLAVKVVHHEGTKDRDLVLVGELVELILEVHARSDVPTFPEHVHHLSPPADFRVATPSTRLRDHISRQSKKDGRIGHGVTHELWQELVGIDDGELPPFLCGANVYAFCLEPWTECLPMGSRRHEDDSFAVRKRGRGEATDGAVKKLLVLIELDDMVARPRAGQKPVPRLAFVQPMSMLSLRFGSQRFRASFWLIGPAPSDPLRVGCICTLVYGELHQRAGVICRCNKFQAMPSAFDG